MLERHNRRECRHFRRPPQDVGAVDDMALHDLEFVLRQLVRLVQHFERCVDLADVMHEGRKAELTQKATHQREDREVVVNDEDDRL